jgi:hypothetical protein
VNLYLFQTFASMLAHPAVVDKALGVSSNSPIFIQVSFNNKIQEMYGLAP